jgi:hypothetical protein
MRANPSSSQFKGEGCTHVFPWRIVLSEAQREQTTNNIGIAFGLGELGRQKDEYYDNNKLTTYY